MTTMDLIAAHALAISTGSLKDAEVASPCVGVCQMDVAGQFCIGCLRTLDEISAWRRLDGAGRLAVWGLIVRRAQADTV
ncbi:hypothetical protein os1_35050 [Comamonadaceae bacterium OS-1]|nr:hypothetical protein os1_35050 [Comamonadaceae bacterium OS-1]